MSDVSLPNLNETVALDAHTFPLFGKRLIEASAGTGKTYTIANLYLRLLVPSGSEFDLERPLTVDQILVVTFTEAATAELKGRIRARIRAARKTLMSGHSDDAFLMEWRNHFTDAQIADGIEKLLYAEKQMDEAAVFTIHGFCQRMLSQNAFESRMLFRQEIETDEMAPLTVAVKDVWRRFVADLSETEASFVRRFWAEPMALLKELRVLQSQPDAQYHQIDFDWRSHIQALRSSIQDIKQTWLKSAPDIIDAMNNSGIKRNFWKKDPSKDIRALEAWANSSALSVPDCLKFIDAREHETRLAKGGEAPRHRIFAQVAELRALSESLGQLKSVLIPELWQQVQARMLRWKRSTQSLTFTDLLTTLDSALTDESERVGQQVLAERIRTTYPIALIDEFQDTDPVQYRIFSNIYKDAHEGQKQIGKIMIGDPKQAIYAFRGADIFTYLSAKKDAHQIYSLATNYRSSAAMIRAVNGLFSTQSNPFQVEGIPFVKVKDREVKTTFYRHGQPQAALQFLFLDEEHPVSVKRYREAMAERSAHHLHRLLNEGLESTAMVGDDPIRPKDVALLVSNFTQAQLLKSSLSERGIPSVYLSDKGSVYDSQEATELLIILNAIIEQGKENATRSALATGLIGWTLEEIDALNHNDLSYEKWARAFQQYWQLWDDKGLLPMLRSLLEDLSIPASLLSRKNGERRLTDLLHLFEKLQEKSLELDSKEGVLRFLRLSIQNPNGDSDEQKIRLETDAELVRIVTIHKSKGLEYPIVYLPFAFTPVRNASKEALYHDQNGQLMVSFDPTDEEAQQHFDEAYAAEIRLAYVALTRSKDACFIGSMEVGKAPSKTKAAELHNHLSGVGALVCEGEPLDAGDLLPSLMRFAEQQGNALVKVESVGQDDEILPPYQMNSDADLDARVRQFTGHIERDWWVGSYSSLVVEAPHEASAQPGFDELDIDSGAASNLLDQAVESPDEQAIPEEASRFTFPKGANPGTFLHDVLEGKAFNGVTFKKQTQDMGFSELLKVSNQTALDDYFTAHGYEEWADVLRGWLPDMLNAPIISGSEGRAISLSDLAPEQCKKEMEFYIPVSKMNALQLDRIARLHDVVSQSAPPIQDRPLKGMLKGFIDLLFEWEGRYYVLDYKSNHLGYAFEDYNPDAMQTAIAEHRYDLQYQIYTLALHRFLKQRLPNYDYEKHVGGVCYLFLRGLQKEGATGVFSNRLSQTHVEAIDALFANEQQEEKQFGLL
ncbi:exodeoxyribonuclease V subunit beta [Marinomonas mediterranea]|uniref:exodeoxyribonuclease V subunit beta n=1 Tax=Marinomonas mediterranea TaxID=119864 RepID=UPI00234B2B81|nr:exodeoxyribonuclease V subunit beta [Marinomonas mediterranea]WCN09965.1 exodeoxyribonuclease V subunit beta [Marinomonas mediterranea]